MAKDPQSEARARKLAAALKRNIGRRKEASAVGIPARPEGRVSHEPATAALHREGSSPNGEH